MELYNAMIRGVEGLAGSSTPRRFDYDPANAWEDTGAFELVMLRDAAFELGGGDKPAVNFTCVTTSPTLIPKDEILVFGPDLGELKGDCAYARVALLRVGDIESDDEEDTEQAFRAIQDMDFVKYRVFPKGYMIRTSSESSREQVRISKEALQKGVSFQRIGNDFIQQYKKNLSGGEDAVHHRPGRGLRRAGQGGQNRKGHHPEPDKNSGGYAHGLRLLQPEIHLRRGGGYA